MRHLLVPPFRRGAPALQRGYPPAVAAPTLSRRALNRALLARQGLLARSADPPEAMIERLVGMQAQEPEDPYVGLWSRLEGFDPADLSGLIASGAAVRGQFMRATIHLVTGRDRRAIHPVTRPVLARTFRAWAPRLNGAPPEEVAAAGRQLLAAGPRTRAELGALLAPRWPDAEPAALAQAVTFHLPLVQVPPRGLWGGRGQATWALVEDRIGPLDPEPSVDALLLRYLRAFGPASPADMRTWSGLTGLRDAVDRLRPGLRAFRDEAGRELLDVEDGLLADPETPAPPRFLPEYDNVALSHADRARIAGPLGPVVPVRSRGSLLVDGFVRALWSVRERDGEAVLTVERFLPAPDDPPGTVDDVVAEGLRLLQLLRPGVLGSLALAPAPEA
jgi:hypothetical protein